MPNADELLKQCIEVAYDLSPYLERERQSKLNIFINNTRNAIGKDLSPEKIRQLRQVIRNMLDDMHRRIPTHENIVQDQNEQMGRGLRRRKGKGNFFGRNRVHQEPIAEQIENIQATPVSRGRNEIEQRIRNIDTDIYEVEGEMDRVEMNIALFPNATGPIYNLNNLNILRNELRTVRDDLLHNLYNNYIFPEAEVEMSAPLAEARRGRGLKKSKK